MRCPNCGAESEKKVCEYCGSVLESPREPVPPPPPPPVAPVPPPINNMPGMPNGTFTPPMNGQPVKKGCGCGCGWLIIVLAVIIFMFAGVLFVVLRSTNSWVDESVYEVTEVLTDSEDDDPLYTYKAGMYKVGTDIPAGLYVLQATGDISAYYAVTTDSTGGVGSIVANDNFSAHVYVEVEDGQYLEVKRAKFAPESAVPAFTDQDGVYSEGMYKVGKDLPAGEYKVRALSGKTAYVAVYSKCTARIGNIVTNDNFTEEKYVTVADGQYILISRGEIIQ